MGSSNPLFIMYVTFIPGARVYSAYPCCEAIIVVIFYRLVHTQQNQKTCTLEEAIAMIDNRCSQFSLLLTVLLFATTSISVVSGQPTGEQFIALTHYTHTHESLSTHFLFIYTHTGVHLLLRGAVYSNNSIISTNEIGETNSTSNTGLQCITDRRPCCATVPNRFGEWLFPDGTVVPTQGRATSFYRTRRDNGTVNLNRLNTNVFMPTGLFCCVVPDALNVMQRICAIICELVNQYTR